MYLALIVPQGEMGVRMSQGQPRERFAHVSQLGLRGSHEPCAHRRVEEQVANLDRRARWTTARGNFRRLAGHDF